MKKFIVLLIIASILVFVACEFKQPGAPQLNTLPQQVILAKMMSIGGSYTAGFQSNGLVQDFQKNSFPYLIAKQMGITDDFQIGLLAQPGFGSADLMTGQAFGPLKWDKGTQSILPGDPVPNGINGISALLFAGGNAELARPYDNLGIPGADLNDILTTTAFEAGTNTGNPFFDLTLRNPNFAGTTMLDQAILLQPSVVLFNLPGGNDYLGAALSGTAVEGVTLTSQANFRARFTSIINRLLNDTKAAIVTTNLPYIDALPYVNILDPSFYANIYKDFTIPGLGTVTVPVVFGSDFQAIDFDPAPGSEIYLPLLTEEGFSLATPTASPVKHLLLPFLSEYQASGLGVPDSTNIATTLIALGFDAMTAAFLAQQAVLGMMAQGLNPSGVAIPATLSLTVEEENTINTAVDGYNAIINDVISGGKPITKVDLIAATNRVRANPGMYGVTALFVLVDPNTTIFSLDGVHPSNAGQAFIANEFIKEINRILNVDIPEINPGSFTGQYGGPTPFLSKKLPEQIKLVKNLYVRDELLQ
jgi:hypothetical protein